jgi:protein-L-isoaspartate(D-aspartate) O-methyltransferase
MSSRLDFTDARARMILGQVKTNDVQDEGVIGAMEGLHRESYVPALHAHLAYADVCVPLKAGRFLLDPRSLAKMLQALRIARHERVLDVASGTGYSTAVLCQLSEDVVALEEDRDLAAAAAQNLAKAAKLGALFGAVGPHKAGYSGKAPYDAILVNGAITAPPDAWAGQLKQGGRLIAVVNQGPVGKARLFVQEGGRLAGRDVFDATVPLLPGFEAAREFSF